MLKRSLDIFLSIACLFTITPLIPIIGLLIKLDSKGPIFYSCDRIGKDGKIFQMHKFRTMIDTSVFVGECLAPKGDVRITNFGRFLRQTKLNELPQLFNVLKGEMSFVGPRPEDPNLAEFYPEKARVLFTIRPGLVGPSQILNRNEDELYPEGVDPKQYYLNHILPKKLEIDLQYVKKPIIQNDLKYILLSIKETMTGAIRKRHFFENKVQIYLFLFDIFFVIGCYLFAIKLRFEDGIPAHEFPILIKTFPILLIYQIICFIGFGLYSIIFRYLSLSSYVDVIKAVTVGLLSTAITSYAIGFYFPRSIWIIYWFCLNSFMIFIRVPGKLIRDKIHGEEKKGIKRVFIFGAGDKGKLAAIHLSSRLKIMGFLDDDRTKKNKWFMEYRILGNRYDIEPLSKIYPVDEVIIASSDIDKKSLDHLISLCQRAFVGYSIFATQSDDNSDRIKCEIVRNKKIIQRVCGQEFQVDWAKMNSSILNKSFLIIGPSNALGLELLKCLIPLHPREIILLDRYESYLNETCQKAFSFIPKNKIKPELSIDPLPIATEKILSSNCQPDIVIHMGTRKHLSSFAMDPLHIIRENILNTWDLFQISKKAGCKIFAITSSICAESPVNLLQATLRLAEHYLQSPMADSTIKSAVVRLFDIVENKGSILQTIKNHVESENKLLLNHPKESRYFITVSSAAQLILFALVIKLETKFNNKGVFIPVFNEPIKIVDLAKFMIQEFGLKPYVDVKISYAYKNNPEKWEQELHLNYKLLQETAHKNLKNILPLFIISETEAEDDISEFRDLVERKDRDGVTKKVKHILHKIVEKESTYLKQKLLAGYPETIDVKAQTL